MKTILKLTASVLFTGIILFLSCSKSSSSNASLPVPQQTMDTLRGREFEFNDLTWREFVGWGTNVMVYIDRPDLFFNPYREMKVTIRLDTSATWQNVFRDDVAYSLAGNNFFYAFGFEYFFNYVPGRLYLYPYPENYSLNGKKVSIRVKFL